MKKEKRIERLRLNEYILYTDTTLNWVLVKEYASKKTGETKEKVVGYYPVLETACQKMLTLKTMKAETSSINELITAIRDARNEIIGALKVLGL